MKRLYVDYWGDKWKRFGFHYVIRLKDNNIGGWFDGKGLTAL